MIKSSNQRNTQFKLIKVNFACLMLRILLLANIILMFSFISPCNAVEIELIRQFTDPYNDSPQIVSSNVFFFFSDEIQYLFLLLTNTRDESINNIICTIDTHGIHDYHLVSNVVESTVFLVHSWWQLDRPTLPSETQNHSMVFVPEILIKQSSSQISAHDSMSLKYRYPVIPIEYDTNLSPNSKRYYCLKLHMPKVAELSRYVLDITFWSNSEKIAQREIKIEVFPQLLPTHNKIRGIFYMGSFDNDSPNYADKQLMLQQLRDIKNHGFTNMAIVTHSPGEMEWFYRSSRVLGFDSKILFYDNIQKSDQALANSVFTVKKLGGKVFVGGVDEPNRQDKLPRHIQYSKKYHTSGYKVWTSIRTDVALKLRSVEPLDWVNHHYDDLLFQYVLKFRPSDDVINTYYWQMYMETPVLNRYLSGFFLFFSKFDGILPFVYRYAFKGDQPWTVDVREITNRAGTNTKQMKYFYCTYPATSGTCTTLEWESFIAGDQDFKYCILIADLVDSLKLQGRIETANNINTEFWRRLQEISRFYPANRLKPYKIYEGELAENMEMLRNWIIATWQKYGVTKSEK